MGADFASGIRWDVNEEDKMPTNVRDPATWSWLRGKIVKLGEVKGKPAIQIMASEVPDWLAADTTTPVTIPFQDSLGGSFFYASCTITRAKNPIKQPQFTATDKPKQPREAFIAKPADSDIEDQDDDAPGPQRHLEPWPVIRGRTYAIKVTDTNAKVTKSMVARCTSSTSLQTDNGPLKWPTPPHIKVVFIQKKGLKNQDETFDAPSQDEADDDDDDDDPEDDDWHGQQDEDFAMDRNRNGKVDGQFSMPTASSVSCRCFRGGCRART